MKLECFELVDPVLQRGMDLKERFLQSAPVLRGDGELHRTVDETQGELKRLLQDRRWTAAGQDGGGRLPATHDESFLGIRYALVCWLDEIFIHDCPLLAPHWNERKLEHQLYGTNDRATAFLRQAQLAEGRAEGDALEVYFLCALLGFQGEWHNKPEDWQAWVARVRTQLPERQRPDPPGLDPPAPPLDERPLYGCRRFETMTRVWQGALLVLMSVAVGFAVYFLNR
jgi:type IV/VI secretion system ImpK/VasF family protein